MQKSGFSFQNIKQAKQSTIEELSDSYSESVQSVNYAKSDPIYNDLNVKKSEKLCLVPNITLLDRKLSPW